MIKKDIKRVLKYAYVLIRNWATTGVDKPPRRFFLSKVISSFVYGAMARVSASQGGWTGAEWAISCSIYFRPTSGKYMQKAAYLLKLSQSALALDTLTIAFETDSKNYTLRNMLASVMATRRQWNEVISLIEETQATHENSVSDMLLLAKSYLEVGRYTEALLQYTTILENPTISNSTKYETYYGKGLSLKRLGRDTEADKALHLAVKYSTDPVIKRVGVGYLHEIMHYYDDAILEYKKQLKNNPNDAELLSRLGSTFRRMFHLDEALACNRKAVDINDENSEYCYQLGLTYEFMGNSKQAKTYYTRAESLSPDTSVYGFRLGITLAKLNKVEAADKVFQRHKIFSFGNIKRSTVRGLPGRKQRYAEYFEAYPINEKIILYESMLGLKFSCNPYALFKELIKDKRFSDYTHVWVIDNPQKLPKYVIEMKNVIVVQRSSDLYMRYLVSAKYLINNSTFPSYFVRKEEQSYLNTWHGTPWKTLGADIKGEIFSHTNTARNLLQASHILSPNKHTTSVLLDSNDIKTTCSAEVAELGYPRIDNTINLDEKTIEVLRSQLDIDPRKKTVLYAPTWRGIMTNKNIDTKKIQRDIKRLQKLNVNVLFRGHHYTEDNLKRVKVVPASIDTNELLAVVDILVTDYSSIAFDFMPTGKPIVYYLYDFEEYTKTRGLYFSPEEMAGTVTATIDETTRVVESLAQQKSFLPDNSYIQARDSFCPYDDGNASMRVIEWLFFDALDQGRKVVYQDSRPTVLMYAGGFKSNGITTSFLNLLSKIDKDKIAVATAVTVKDLQLDPDRLKKYNEQPLGVARLGIIGGMTKTLVQQSAAAFFAENHTHASQLAKSYYEKIYQREFIRCFGSKRYDAVLDYSGYNPYQASLFAQSNASRKAIYTHNDLEAERIAKYANLENVFRQYPYYTKIISVSAANRDINRNKIARKYSIDESLFDYCDNIQDSARVIAMAREEPSKKISQLMKKNEGYAFINLARLSPEKDHRKLVLAFQKVVNHDVNNHLYICGDGPLRGSVDTLIKNMDLEQNIHMLGYQDNPYAIMKRADCFVLSSNYEGQPVVLYEAMALGLSVVATDIKANKNVLGGGYGRLVDNSIDGLALGMIDMTESKVKNKKFDINTHERQSLQRFYEVVLGL